MSTTDNGTIRKFETGATRDTATNKNDYEGFLSPLVLEAFGDYMTENRKQTDGSIRDSDNWQKGIPQAVYIKSAFRHFMQWWKLHRGLETKDEKGKPVDLNHAICGLLFNVMGYLHETLKPKVIIEACPETIEKSEPVGVGFPRFFFRVTEGGHAALYVIASKNVGRGFFVSSSPPAWGTCNWDLEEMRTYPWSGEFPLEVNEEEAVKNGLPNFVHWPSELKHALNPKHVQYLRNTKI